MADQTIEKTPTANQSVNKPSSGTYGEKADISRLKAALPESGGPSGAPPGEMSPVRQSTSLPGGPPGRPSAAPAGVPTAVMHPSQRPGVPLNQPLAQPAPPLGGAQSAQQARIALLDALASDPTVSEETREWASTVLEMLVG